MQLKLIGYWVATAAITLETLAGGVTDLIHGGTVLVTGQLASLAPAAREDTSPRITSVRRGTMVFESFLNSKQEHRHEHVDREEPHGPYARWDPTRHRYQMLSEKGFDRAAKQLLVQSYAFGMGKTLPHPDHRVLADAVRQRILFGPGKTDASLRQAMAERATGGPPLISPYDELARQIGEAAYKVTDEQVAFELMMAACCSPVYSTRPGRSRSSRVPLGWQTALERPA